MLGGRLLACLVTRFKLRSLSLYGQIRSLWRCQSDLKVLLQQIIVTKPLLLLFIGFGLLSLLGHILAVVQDKLPPGVVRCLLACDEVYGDSFWRYLIILIIWFVFLFDVLFTIFAILENC